MPVSRQHCCGRCRLQIDLHAQRFQHIGGAAFATRWRGCHAWRPARRRPPPRRTRRSRCSACHARRRRCRTDRWRRAAPRSLVIAPRMARAAPTISSTVGSRTASAVRKRAMRDLADLARHDGVEGARALLARRACRRSPRASGARRNPRRAHAGTAMLARESAGSSAAAHGRSREAMLSGWNCTPCTGWRLVHHALDHAVIAGGGDFQRRRHAVAARWSASDSAWPGNHCSGRGTRSCRCDGCGESLPCIGSGARTILPP